MLLPVAGVSDELSIFEVPLEKLMEYEVKSAGLVRTTAGQAPGHVQVFDMTHIELTPVRTIGDLLAMHATGSSVGNHIRQGQIHGVRGVSIDNSSKTLVMLDGQQINQRSHFGYMIGLASPLLGDLQSVEVINGPGAIQHGSGAINGFINLIPKTGETHPGSFVRAEYGDAESLWLVESGHGFTYGDGSSLFVYAGAFGADGFEPDEDWGAEKRYASDVRAYGYNEPNYRVSSHWEHEAFDLNFFITEANRQKNSWLEHGDWHSQQLGARPRYTVDLADDQSIEFAASVLLSDHASTSSPAPEGSPYSGGSETHLEGKVTYRGSLSERQAVAFGLLYGDKDFEVATQHFGDDVVGALEAVNTRWQEFGLFAEDVITVNEAVTVSLGLRYDVYELDPVSGANPGDMSFSPG